MVSDDDFESLSEFLGQYGPNFEDVSLADFLGQYAEAAGIDPYGPGSRWGADTLSAMGLSNDTNISSLKPTDWSELLKTLKGLGGKAVDFATSPQGIMSLIGAAANYADRQRPSGGGTTMAYQGPAELKRKIVQGPYGPVAEYEGVGGGSPDYTRFVAPTVTSPAPPPSAPDYEELLNLIRSLAPKTAAPATPVAAPGAAPVAAPVASTPGTKPRSDMGFTRDPNAIGASVMTPWYNKKTGQTYIASDTAWQPPSADWVQGEFDASGSVNPAAKKEPATSKPPVEDPATFTGPPSLQVSQTATAGEKAEEYRRLRRFGLSDSQIRAMVDAQMGQQTDDDWQYLLNLALPSATPTGQQTVGQGAQEDPFVAAIKQATATPQEQIPVYKDPKSESTLSVKKDYLEQPLEFTFTDKVGRSETVGATNTTPINELAEKYGIDLSKAFGAGTTSRGGGIGWFDATEKALDPNLYANVGNFAPGAPQQMVYSPEDEALVFQPLVSGPDLGTQRTQIEAKPFAEVEGILQKYKQNAPKTQEELVEANSAWLDYQNRFANSQGGKEPGRYDSSLKPIAMLPQTYSGYGALDKTLTDLSSDISKGTAQSLTGSPFTGGQAQTLNQTLASIGSNPLVQQTINKIAAFDPSAKFSPDDVSRLAGQIQELGAENAIANFVRDKQNLVGFGTSNWTTSHNKDNPTWAAYQDLLNNIGGLYAQEPKKLAQGGPVRMEDGAFVMTKRAVDGAGGPRGIQQLVPGARMIKGPGHGTSDSIPAYIQGRNGRTPARLSNGEAYVPPGRDTDKLYALMKSLERNA